ncbi:MAG: hypothetical protein K8L99_24845 [Anaerolineae bacterium]|nr:hypothetical protein [Anaerolineae bacterium]
MSIIMILILIILLAFQPAFGKTGSENVFKIPVVEIDANISRGFSDPTPSDKAFILKHPSAVSLSVFDFLRGKWLMQEGEQIIQETWDTSNNNAKLGTRLTERNGTNSPVYDFYVEASQKTKGKEGTESTIRIRRFGQNSTNIDPVEKKSVLARVRDYSHNSLRLEITNDPYKMTSLTYTLLDSEQLELIEEYSTSKTKKYLFSKVY